jgi:hypothetical protein
MFSFTHAPKHERQMVSYILRKAVGKKEFPASLTFLDLPLHEVTSLHTVVHKPYCLEELQRMLQPRKIHVHNYQTKKEKPSLDTLLNIDFGGCDGTFFIRC